MRILFSFVGGPGHFEPMVPIARAAQIAGHTVAVACAPSLVPVVESQGLTALGVGPSGQSADSKRLPLRPVDIAREERDLRERFARWAARLRAAEVLVLSSKWRPEVMVADEVDFGSMLAAEVLSVPYATVLVIAAGTLARREVVGPSLEILRAEYGLPADPDFTAPSRYLALCPFPPALRDPIAPPLPATTHLFRAVDGDGRELADRPRGDRLAAPPNVYFTLGTEFNVESGDLFTRVIAGLRELPINVLVTVGRQLDPGELGRQPPNVQVERYVPQAQALSWADLVVFHGGSGTLTGALAHGLPMVMVAIGADQPANASRCRALGLGVTLNSFRATPAAVREATTRVLTEPSFRQAAGRLRTAMARQPDPATAVTLLERLAMERRPIRRRHALPRPRT